MSVILVLLAIELRCSVVLVNKVLFCSCRIVDTIYLFKCALTISGLYVISH